MRDSGMATAGCLGRALVSRDCLLALSFGAQRGTMAEGIPAAMMGAGEGVVGGGSPSRHPG